MEEWPNLSNIFDESQYSAFKMGLTQEFSTIQGPPGTGKTYIGLKIAETIISNKKNKPPLLVLCYTNHALDQFLEKLLTKTQNIIRVGGQSSNKELDGFNLKHTHKNSQFKQLKESYYKLLQTIRNICTTLELLKSENHIVNISKFVHIVNFPFDDFIEKFQLKNNQLPIVNWLLTDKAIETPKLFYNLTDNVTQIKEIDKQTIDNNPNISNKEIHDSFYDLNDFIKKQKAIKLMIDSKEFFKKHNCNLLELKQYYDKLDEEVTFLKVRQ